MNKIGDVVIRKALDGDGPEIANVHLNSWRETYHGLLPQTFLDQLPLTFKRRMIWWANVIVQYKEFGLYVAEDKTGIVGFSCVQPARDESMAGYGELGAIYLLQKFKGAGVGYALLQQAINHLRLAGFTKAYCWILEKNPTLRFYEKSGAVLNGMTKKDEIGGQMVEELALEWKDLGRFKM